MTPDVPAGWRIARLEEIVLDGPTNGYSPVSAHGAQGTLSLKLSATTQGHLILNAETIKHLHEVLPADSWVWLEPGDLLVQRSNTPELVGTAAIYDGPPRTYIYPDLMMRLRFADGATTRWVWRYLNSPEGRQFFKTMAVGAAASMPKISGAKLKAMPVPVPPLSEQRYIADILDKADNIRRKRKDAIGLTEELLRSTFFEIFGDPATNPKGWPVCLLEDLCSDIVDCPHTTPTYGGVPLIYPCVRTSDLQNGFFDWSTTRLVAAPEYEARTARLRPKAGDVFYTREGERFGIAALVPVGIDPCLGQRMMLLRANEAVALPAFLWGTMNSAAVYRQATAAVGGSTSPHVNVKTIRKFQAMRPPRSLQSQYEKVYRQTLSLRASQLAANGRAVDLFGALVQRAFRRGLAAPKFGHGRERPHLPLFA